MARSSPPAVLSLRWPPLAAFDGHLRHSQKDFRRTPSRSGQPNPFSFSKTRTSTRLLKLAKLTPEAKFPSFFFSTSDPFIDPAPPLLTSIRVRQPPASPERVESSPRRATSASPRRNETPAHETRYPRHRGQPPHTQRQDGQVSRQCLSPNLVEVARRCSFPEADKFAYFPGTSRSPPSSKTSKMTSTSRRSSRSSRWTMMTRGNSAAL